MVQGTLEKLVRQQAFVSITPWLGCWPSSVSAVVPVPATL
jgi:hypothetical protein